MGGIIDVSLDMTKRWNIGLHEDILDEEVVEEDPISDPMTLDLPKNDDNLMTTDEQAELGYFNVYKIVKHKFQQGWRFLVWWENFPVSSSTWEPVSAFVLPNGSVNSVFKAYCLEKGLSQVLQRALSS